MSLATHTPAGKCSELSWRRSMEYNPEARTASKILIAQRFHQQWKDAKIFTCYGDRDFDFSCLTKHAYCRNWDLGDLKIITANWMRGKNEDFLLKRGKRQLAICKAEYHDLKAFRARQTASAGSPPAAKTYTANCTARSHDGSGPGQRGKMAAAAEGEPTIAAGAKPTNRPPKPYMDGETLRLIENVRDAHEAVGRRTAKLVAHLLKSAQQNEPSRIPPHKRIEASHPIDYPWRNKKTERDPRRRGGRS